MQDAVSGLGPLEAANRLAREEGAGADAETLGCSSRDQRLTRMAEQQADLNREMVKLNRDVAREMTRIAQENAEFRKEALAVQKQLHEQRVELIEKQTS